MTEMKLFLHPLTTGMHLGGWRHPSAHSGGLFEFEFFADLVKKAEAAKFDAVFFADEPGYRPIAEKDAFAAMDIGKLEPVTLLAALAAVTSRIGLIGTVSTSFNEPYNLARKFASLDHISKGRAGWNAVTSTTDLEARNFGLDSLPPHAERYARAAEFVEVVKGLWDSWEDGAFLRDKASGRYTDPGKLHALDHRGEHFQVFGPLNVARPPQGHPLVVQAGGSEIGRALGARTADAIFTGYPPLPAAQAFYADMKKRAAACGRHPDEIKIMVSLQVIAAASEKEALAIEAELDRLVPDALGMSWLQLMLGNVDLSGHDPDGPLPDLPLTNSGQMAQQSLITLARENRMSIRDLARHVGATRGGSRRLTGSAEQVADEMERYFKEGAADGFVVTPATTPKSFDDFTALVVPILQERGLFRRDYQGTTLREHLGLARPANRYQTDPALHVEPAIWKADPAITLPHP